MRPLMVLFMVSLAAVASAAPGAPPGPPGTAEVVFIGSQQVEAAFAKGMPLVETDLYKVHASRRDRPGMAEVHMRDTDVIYVLEGSATLVTGGTVNEPKQTARDEVRGVSIAGGTARRLSRGDVMIVPSGVPHWFQQVEGPLVYYVVKVTAPAGGPR
jgi:mannose-6-phosphate isomerase-like protein (cupin superfamily)